MPHFLKQQNMVFNEDAPCGIERHRVE
jgi:hypothetical protein